MQTVTVSLSDFYAQFPIFNADTYSSICPLCFDRSQIYISSTYKNSVRLVGDKRALAIYLLTAHMSFLTLNNQNNTGQLGQIGSASVDGVSIGYVQLPTSTDAFSYWLTLSPYGLELLALLETLTAVPFYVGGSLERVF